MLRTTDEQIVECKYEAVKMLMNLLVKFQKERIPVVDFSASAPRSYPEDPKKCCQIDIIYFEEMNYMDRRRVADIVADVVPFSWYRMHVEKGRMTVWIDYPMQDCLGCPLHDKCTV